MVARSPIATPAMRRHTVVVELRDRPGALYRAIGLVRRRDYNVSSVVVGASERAGISRMVLVVEATDVRQVVLQLSRLVDVVSVGELARDGELVRETVLAVIEVHDDEADLLAAAEIAGARVTHRADARLLLELTAAPSRIDDFVETVRRFDLQQLARTGPIVIRESSSAAASAVVVPTGASVGPFTLVPSLSPAEELSR